MPRLTALLELPLEDRYELEKIITGGQRRTLYDLVAFRSPAWHTAGAPGSWKPGRVQGLAFSISGLSEVDGFEAVELTACG